MIGSIRGTIIATASDKVLVEIGGAAVGRASGGGSENNGQGNIGDAGGASGSIFGAGGIGYWVHVTPQTLATLMSDISSSGSSISDSHDLNQGRRTHVFFHTEHVIREDAQLLYGFLTAEERICFSTLTSISGIGPQLALAVLATHNPADLQTLLLEGDIDSLCLVPGIGPKKARQLMATMKDRFAIADFRPADAAAASSPRAEARQALSELGYSAEEVQAALADISSDDSTDTETLVKAALSVLAK